MRLAWSLATIAAVAVCARDAARGQVLPSSVGGAATTYPRPPLYPRINVDGPSAFVAQRGPTPALGPPSAFGAPPAGKVQFAGSLRRPYVASSPAGGALAPGRGWANSQATCDGEPASSIIGSVGYDAWRGISDGGWENNGIHVGANYGTRLGAFSDQTGIGFQIGGSVGVFDWSGTDYRLTDQNAAETQGFFTYGFFRKPNDYSNWTASIVQDWMFNDNFGVFAQNPTLSQLRWQLGYAISARNEFGVWGASRVLGDTRLVGGVGDVSWRPINQFNPYWHYKWAPGGADTTIWIGVPERHRFGGSGSLGDYVAGALANVPLSDSAALYTLVTYMHPSSRPGAAGSNEDAWNFTIGVSFYPGRNARSSTVGGRCWLPQLPLANNGLFLVDTNRH